MNGKVLLYVLMFLFAVLKERKKETQKRGLRNRLNPTLVPAIRVPGPREQTYTARARQASVGQVGWVSWGGSLRGGFQDGGGER